MSNRNDVVNGLLVYTCNCGWIDKNHAVKTSNRPNVGAGSLWKQIKDETGTRSKLGDGFQVTYRQDMGGRLPVVGLVTVGETGEYFVKTGLSKEEKESVALAIFMEVSTNFEAFQGLFFLQSSFSAEDLVSDLVSFYNAVRPGTDYIRTCHPVSPTASLAVWDQHGDVGRTKNHTFYPIFYPCAECQNQPIKFPAELQAIKPAAKGTVFRDWTMEDDLGKSLADEVRRSNRGPKF
jgi:hypothetical protein